MLKVCIDAGHGGIDPGAVVGDVKEKDLALVYANALRVKLCEDGISVVMTREQDKLPNNAPDKNAGLKARYVIANTEQVTLFVSCHFNASASPSAKGFEVFHARGSTRGRAAAVAIYREVTGDGPSRVYPDQSPQCGNRRLAVLRGTNMPAVLLEFGYLTNPNDRASAQVDEWRDEMVTHVADGIVAWLRAEGKMM